MARIVTLGMPIVETRVEYFPRQMAPERIEEHSLFSINDAVLDAHPVPTCHDDAGAHERPDRLKEVNVKILLLPIRGDSRGLSPKD